MPWFDVHAHLTHPQFDGDRDAAISRAVAAGVGTVVANGLNPPDNRKVLDLASRYPQVKPAVGFYPVEAVLAEMQAALIDYPHNGAVVSPEEGIASVREHIDRCVAVGEIGLDGYWVPERFWPLQDRVFCELVEMAMAADKPVIIHSRKRERRAFDLLRELGAERVNWHCFSSKTKLARAIAEHGHYLSIPANARRSQGFTRMLESLPKERLLLETDCPYLAPTAGERSEPSCVGSTAAYAAELWNTPIGEVDRQLSCNFQALFGFAP